MNVFKSYVTRASITIAIALAAIGLTVAPAYAGGPIVYNQRGSYVPMMYAPTSNVGVQHWMRNSTRFDMRCWTDKQWFNGNYGSSRWFWGQAYDTGSYGYVHSSYVYYQWGIPHC